MSIINGNTLNFVMEFFLHLNSVEERKLLLRFALFPVRVMDEGAMALGEVDTPDSSKAWSTPGELSCHSILSSYCYWVEINMSGMYIYVCV